MSLSAVETVDTTPAVLGGSGNYNDNETIQQDAGRGVADMVHLTVMVIDAADQKLKPMTILTDVTSESSPVGLLWSQDVAAAGIVAGDVTGIKLMVGGNIRIDEDKIVLENSLTLASLITVPAGKQRTIRQALAELGIFATKSYTNGLIAPVA